MSTLTPKQKQKVRASLAAHGRAAIANEPRIHYSMDRRFWYVDVIGVGSHEFDCSGLVGNAFWNAMHDTGIYLHDPLDCKYQGVGNTTTLERYLRAHGKAVTTQGYLVGDICRVGTGGSAHVIYCIAKGTKRTAKWVSHGWEGGPVEVQLWNYRTSEFVGVWRHPALL